MESPSQARVLVCILLCLAGWAVFQWCPGLLSPRPHGVARTAPVYRAPVEHRHALDGTFYLVRYAAVWTPRGTHGFEPGCEVHLVKTNPASHTVVVSDGQQAIELSPLMLTTDLDVADAVRRADQAAQAALVNDRERQREAYEIAHRPIYIAHAQDVYAAELERVRGSAIGVAYNPLSQPAQPVDDGAVPNALSPYTPTPRVGSPGVGTSDLDPALASFLNQSAFGHLPSASNGGGSY